MKLKELESQDFINKFTETIIEKAKKSKQKEEKYTVHFKKSNYLANINLDEPSYAKVKQRNSIQQSLENLN